MLDPQLPQGERPTLTPIAMRIIGLNMLAAGIAATFNPHLKAQDFVNVLPPGNNSVRSLTTTADGALLAGLRDEQGQWTLLKLDGQGEVLWSKRTGYVEHWEDAQGATRLVRDLSSNEDDTYFFEMATLEPDGGSSNVQRHSLVNGPGVTQFGGTVDLTSNATGELFIAQDLVLERILLTKTDPLGNILWSRSLIPSNDAPYTTILPTSDEGVIVARMGSGALGETTLQRFDATGELVWSLRASFQATGVYSYDRSQAFRTSDDGVVIYDHGYSGTEDWIFLSRFDQAGELQWSRAYRKEWVTYPDLTYIGFEHPDGRLQIGVNDALMLTASGALIGTTAHRIPTQADGFPELRYGYYLSLSHAGDILFQGDRIWSIDTVLGITDRLRMFGRFPIDLGNSCFWNEVTAVPYEEYTATQSLVELDNPGYLQTVWWNTFSSESITWEAFEDVDIFDMGDGCELPEIAEQATAVEDAVVPNAFALRPSLQHAGEAVLLDTDIPLTVEVFDMAGRVVLRSSATNAGTHILSTGMLPAGMYMVHGRALNGRPMGIQRLVLN